MLFMDLWMFFCSELSKMQDVHYIRLLKHMESVEVDDDDEMLDVVCYYFVAVFNSV